MNFFQTNTTYTGEPMAGRPPTKEAPPFGKRLAAFRKAHGLSQSQLARLVNTTQKTIDYYERRAQNPTAEFVQKASTVLGVSVDELLGHSVRPTRKSGPPSRLQQLTEQLSHLPRNQQKVVVEMLEGFLQRKSANGSAT